MCERPTLYDPTARSNGRGTLQVRARHFVMLDQPQAFNETLRKFLAALAAR